VAIDARVVQSVDDIHRVLLTWPIGEPLTLTIVRGTDRREVRVTPIESP